MFSRRIPAEFAPNRLTQTLARLRKSNAPIVDLTESNPTRARIEYPEAGILSALSTPASLTYDPDPRGLGAAREAISGYYAREHGAAVRADDIVVTASTSEAYALVFKTLCDPGDAVLVPRPSYPLFEHLARIECVDARPYDLAYDGKWSIDFDSLKSVLTESVRAIVVVSPNNPTGSTLKHAELERLGSLATERGLALIVDEVFADYCFAPDGTHVATVAGYDGALVFALSGLSKIAALPQVKLGWIAVNGPTRQREQALARLEFAADLFLSAGTPVQAAAAALFDLARPVRDRINERTRSNHAWLLGAVAPETGCTVLHTEGGWSVALRFPNVVTEEDLVLEILERRGVLVHPGYFFDFNRPGMLVVSLLTPETLFQEGMKGVLDQIVGSLGVSGRVSPE